MVQPSAEEDLGLGVALGRDQRQLPVTSTKGTWIMPAPRSMAIEPLVSVEIPVEQAPAEGRQRMVDATTTPDRLHKARGTQRRGVLGGGRRAGADAVRQFHCAARRARSPARSPDRPSS